jgi:hypothetical protein
MIFMYKTSNVGGRILISCILNVLERYETAERSRKSHREKKLYYMLCLKLLTRLTDIRTAVGFLSCKKFPTL